MDITYLLGSGVITFIVARWASWVIFRGSQSSKESKWAVLLVIWVILFVLAQIPSS